MPFGHWSILSTIPRRMRRLVSRLQILRRFCWRRHSRSSVREMARAYAKAVVEATKSFKKLPQKLANTAWRRTMETLARSEIGNENHSEVFSEAQKRFNAVYNFCKGDLTQDIYGPLIHNENHMRIGEINSLFRVSNLGDVCRRISEKQPLLRNFCETEKDKVHGRLQNCLEEFFERRNLIAHSLNSVSSSGPDQILKDIDMFNGGHVNRCVNEIRRPSS